MTAPDAVDTTMQLQPLPRRYFCFSAILMQRIMVLISSLIGQRTATSALYFRKEYDGRSDIGPTRPHAVSRLQPSPRSLIGFCDLLKFTYWLDADETVQVCCFT